MTKQSKDISKFLSDEYKGYVFYVLQNRALPDLRDGLKTGARKIMHAAFNGGLKSGASKKLLNLSGDTLNLSLYPHGDASLNGTIVTLSQQFRFNLNPLYVDGQNGTLRTPKAISAPRYLYVSLSEYADIWKTDSELLEYIYDEGQYVEPECFLPIIPTVICNMQEGMAPGYRFYCMSYNPTDVTKYCIAVLEKSKKRPAISPYIRDIPKSAWSFDKENNTWLCSGTYKVLNSTTLEITELPYNIDFDDFESILNKQIEKGIVKDYVNNSSGRDISYKIKFTTVGKAKLTDKQVDKYVGTTLKLTKQVPSDQLYVLDENKKIRYFNNIYELTEYFVNWRLSIYKKRKTLLLDILNKKLTKNTDLARFIDLIIKNKLKINNRPQKDIKVDMDKYKLPWELVHTSMVRCTKEEYDNLLKDNKELEAEIKRIKKQTIEEMYIDDLKQLNAVLTKQF